MKNWRENIDDLNYQINNIYGFGRFTYYKNMIACIRGLEKA